MSRIEVRQAVPSAVYFVAENLRPEDRMELETASGMTAKEALFASWAWSECSWVVDIDGTPSIAFGVSPRNVVWLVGTPDITKAPKAVLKAAKDVLRALLKSYPYLHNQADCRNELHIRWLELLGFTLGPIVQLNGFPFQRFFKEGSSSCVSPQQLSLALELSSPLAAKS